MLAEGMKLSKIGEETKRNNKGKSEIKIKIIDNGRKLKQETSKENVRRVSLVQLGVKEDATINCSSDTNVT
jgi:hypothetical protein